MNIIDLGDEHRGLFAACVFHHADIGGRVASNSV